MRKLNAVLMALAAGAAACVFALGADGRRAQTSWTITDLGTLGGSGSYPIAINDRGQIIGEAATNKKDPEMKLPIWHPFLWENGKLHDLTIKGSESTTVTGINNRGQIIGSWHSAKTGTHGFLLQDRKLTDLQELLPMAINDRGEIAGVVGKHLQSSSRTFLWRHGTVTYLDRPLAGGTYFPDDEPLMLNARSEVAGSYRYANSQTRAAFIVRNGRLTRIGGARSQAFGLNDLGRVVGVRELDTARRAFLWKPGRMEDLGTLGGDASYAYALNNKDQVAGKATLSGTRQWHAALWAGGEVSDLGTLSHWRFSVATAINDRGTVVGYSYRAINSTSDPAGDQRAFAWRDGELVDLGRLDAGRRYTQAVAVNSGGAIIGLASPQPERRLGDAPSYSKPYGAGRAVLWTPRTVG
jgi:probable HAF family extracellular repeat protein